jgi:alpha-1,6-mannosyltransferase
VVKAAFGTPSGVLTWLSPTTAIGLLLGRLTTAIGLTANDSGVLSGVRLLGTAIGLVLILWLILRPGGRSPVRGAALALAVIVVLGPVVQPWYLLWFLPLFAATGLSARELRVAMILTAVFTIHGMIESSANADNTTDIGDSITFLVAIVVVVIIVAASPRERRLVLGSGDALGIEPTTDDQRERSVAMRWPTGGRIHA